MLVQFEIFAVFLHFVFFFFNSGYHLLVHFEPVFLFFSSLLFFHFFFNTFSRQPVGRAHGRACGCELDENLAAELARAPGALSAVPSRGGRRRLQRSERSASGDAKENGRG